MTSATSNIDFRNALLDDQWIVIIMDEIDALPYETADFVSPDELGRLDARDGVCDPTRYYAELGDIEKYLIAWNEAVAAMQYDVEFAADAYEHGRQDYADGLPCGVFRYYECPCDRQAYAYGYMEARNGQSNG